MPKWISICSLPILLIAFSSCSRPARARRYLDKSKQAYEEAKSQLLSGNPKTAKPLAAKALVFAQKASSLVPTGPLHESIAKKVQSADHLAGSFEDPVKGLLLWAEAVIDGETTMALLLFDHRRLLSETCPDRLAKLSLEEKSQLEEMLSESLTRTINEYSELLANWSIAESNGSVKGQEATVYCDVYGFDRTRGITFWLHKNDGFWRIYDLTIGKDRMSDDFGTMIKRLGEDESLVEFFRGKGLFEAFSQIKDASSMDVVYMKKPLIGRYVRATDSIDATRGGIAVTIEEGTLLKVIDQTLGHEGSREIVVRTTEPDVKEAALARVPERMAEYAGSDEDALWGVSTSEMDSG